MRSGADSPIIDQLQFPGFRFVGNDGTHQQKVQDVHHILLFVRAPESGQSPAHKKCSPGYPDQHHAIQNGHSQKQDSSTVFLPKQFYFKSVKVF